MKNILYILLVATAFASCKSNTKTILKDTATTTNSLDSLTQRLMKEYKPIIQGSWVKADYIQKVIKTKSPAEASDLATDLTAMVIETDSIRNDSLNVNGGWGNHEGGDLWLKFKPGKTKGTIRLGAYDLGYSIKNNDTTLITHYFDKDKKTTKIITYIKAFNKKTKNLGDGTDNLINKALFAGKYRTIDSLESKSEITLTSKGTISGLLNFKTYYILNDLNEEPMNNLDEIIFDLYSNHQISYTFKIKRDTLSLYNILANADSTLQVVGKLKYKLIKQK